MCIDFREKERGRGRERNTDVRERYPLVVIKLATWVCALIGN